MANQLVAAVVGMLLNGQKDDQHEAPPLHPFQQHSVSYAAGVNSLTNWQQAAFAMLAWRRWQCCSL